MYIGIDTSCYTTSVAAVDGEIIADKRILLKVGEGQRGLRQSEGVFQHIKNIPLLTKQIEELFPKTQGICVSATPRREEGSYMPVFLAGLSFAEAISHSLGIPLVKTSHQEGHIAAAVMDTGFDDSSSFLAVHISGGTSEIVLCEKDDAGYKTKIVGGTLDLPAGQLVDRTGVLAGESFPCGRAMQDKAKETEIGLPVTVRGCGFHLSGAETKAAKLLTEAPAEEIYYAVFMCIAKSLEGALKNAIKEYKTEKILIAGGVSANEYIRKYLGEKLDVCFCNPLYSTDNAVGAAYIGERVCNNRRLYNISDK